MYDHIQSIKTEYGKAEDRHKRQLTGRWKEMDGDL